MALIGFVVIMALSFLVSFWDAFVISKLWNWFGATTFSTAQLPMLHAYGLVLLSNVLRGYKPSEKSSADTVDVSDASKRRAVLGDVYRKAFGTTWNKFCASLFALAIAALVHRYAR
jgi:hypothetical protein